MIRHRVNRHCKTALLALLSAIVALFVTACGSAGTDTGTTVAPLLSVPSSTAQPSGTAQPNGDTVTCEPEGPIPDYVWDTLELIDTGDWPPDDAPGTQGGRRFGNYEGELPTVGDDGRPAAYQEWDVNRKKPGRSRDAERIADAVRAVAGASVPPPRTSREKSGGVEYTIRARKVVHAAQP